MKASPTTGGAFPSLRTNTRCQRETKKRNRDNNNTTDRNRDQRRTRHTINLLISHALTIRADPPPPHQG